jgi:serine/threonine-protein kinase RsbW
VVDDGLPAWPAAEGRTVDGRWPVLRLDLHLLRQVWSVRVARRTLDRVLQAMAVDQRCRADLLLALSEGCTNVVEHAIGSDSYEVRVTFDLDCCVVDIIDTGHGVAPPPTKPSMPAAGKLRGRGLSIMALSTDTLQISPQRPSGLAVRFIKRIV